MITLFAALIGLVTNYLYTAVINPNFVEVLLQSQGENLRPMLCRLIALSRFRKCRPR